ncbi:Glycolipid transfer protein 1 [Linum perenne]
MRFDPSNESTFIIRRRCLVPMFYCIRLSSYDLLVFEMVRKLSIYFWGRFTHSLIMFKGLGGKHHHGNQRIEASEEGTSFTAPLEAMKVVRSKNGEILTKPFLDLCKMILPVLDNFGTSLSAVKSDVGGNIHRLNNMYESNPTKFNYLHSIVQPEVEAKTAKSSSSCTNALLWLTRALDFLVAVFQNMLDHPDWGMSQVCSAAYSRTLKKWHNWLSSSSFTVAMKLAPDRKKFVEVIGGTSRDLNAEMEQFCTSLSPFLKENHKFLVII